MALALEIPQIAGNLKMDELSREEVLKYLYLRAGGSFRELQELLKNTAKANASDAQGIKGETDEWYREKIGPIKDVLAETEEEKEPKSKYLGYVTKVAQAGPKGYLMTRRQSCCSRRRQSEHHEHQGGFAPLVLRLLRPRRDRGGPATCSVDALQLGAETAKKERRAPQQKKVGKCESLHAAVAALQLFKSLLYFSRPGQVQPADISEASCQATMCFPGLRGLCQAFRGDLRWMKEAQAPASPATFFAFPTCASAGDPLILELAGESSQKNPSFCGILGVVRLGLRVLTANRVNVLESCSAMRIAAGLRGGCGAAVAGVAVWRGCGAAAGQLRGGCGCGAAGRLRTSRFGGARKHKKLRNSRKAISGQVGGHSSRFGGARKHKKLRNFAQGDFGPSGGTLQPIWGCTKTTKSQQN